MLANEHHDLLSESENGFFEGGKKLKKSASKNKVAKGKKKKKKKKGVETKMDKIELDADNLLA